MAYFDGLASAIFKQDKNGSTIFYPWGMLGRGRILPDEAAKERVLRFVKLYFLISFILLIGLGAFFNQFYAAAVLPILLIWYYLQSRALVSTYPVSDSKPTLRQANAAAAAGFGKPVLLTLLASSALLAVASLWMAATAHLSDQKVTGLLGALFFGACAIKIGYMLKAKS